MAKKYDVYKSKEQKEREIQEVFNLANMEIENYFESEEDIKECLEYMSKFYKYSYQNSLLIQNQCREILHRDATAVGSFAFFKENGYSINKGEKGIKILVPVSKSYNYFVNADGETKECYKATEEEKALIASGELESKRVSRTSYKIGYVFDISQTNVESKDLPKLFPGRWLDDEVENIGEFLRALTELLHAENVTYEIASEELGSVKGMAYTDERHILLNKRNSDLQNAKTIIHEYAHCMLHKNSDLERWEKEFQAELFAYAVCKYFGVDTSDYSLKYISDWSKGKTLDEKKALLRSVNDLVKSFIMEFSPIYFKILGREYPDDNEVEDNTETLENNTVKEKVPASVMDIEQLNVNDVVILKNGARVTMISELIPLTESTMNVLRGISESKDYVTFVLSDIDKVVRDEEVIAENKNIDIERIAQLKTVEDFFFSSEKDMFAIYQIKSGDEYFYDRFVPYDMLQKSGRGITKDKYDCMWIGDLSPTTKLDDIFEQFNENRPSNFVGHSLSVSDVIVFHRNGKNYCRFVDDLGYKEVPDFLGGKTLEPETEIAYKIADRYLSVSESSEGYDYTIYDEAYNDLDGGVLEVDNIKDAVNEAVKALKTHEIALVRGDVTESSINEKVDYDELMELVTERFNKHFEEMQATENDQKIVSAFKERTKEKLHIDAFPSYSDTKQIEDEVALFIENKLVEYEIDATVSEIALSGSRCRGIEKRDSDLDVVVQIEGTPWKEDSIFNALNEEKLVIDGIEVDINPIKVDETGKISNYLKDAENYLTVKAQEIEARKQKESLELNNEKELVTVGTIIELDGKRWECTADGFMVDFKNIDSNDWQHPSFSHIGGIENFMKTHDYVVIHEENSIDEVEEEKKQPVEKEITYTVAECSEFHDIGEFHENIETVGEAIKLFDSIPSSRMNGVKAIGMNIHVPGTRDIDDWELDIVHGNTIDIDMLQYINAFQTDEVAKKIAELIYALPDTYKPNAEYPQNIKDALENLKNGKSVDKASGRVIKFISGMTDEYEIIRTDAPKNVIEKQLIDIVTKEEHGETIENPYGIIEEAGYNVEPISSNIDSIEISDNEISEIYDYYDYDAIEEIKEEPQEETVEEITVDTDTSKKRTRKTSKIEDFGEKIGDAKKDLWKQRGLLVSDLTYMNMAETEKFVKKDNVWKKPDYEQMIKDGVPIHVAWFTKLVRDSLPSKPLISRTYPTDEEIKEAAENYVEGLNRIKELLAKVENDADIKNFWAEFTKDGEFATTSQYGGIYSTLYFTPTKKGRTFMTNKVANALVQKDRHINKYDTNIKEKQFGKSKAAKIPRGYSIYENKPDSYHVKRGEAIANTFYIAHGHAILKDNIETYEKALSMVQEIAKTQKNTRKKSFKPKQLKSVERIGAGENSKDVTGKKMLEAFGFRGGEFGNWLNENDRQYSLDYGYDAFCDLALALGIERRDISLGNRLSIAFGSRGSGNALAHYEPLREVINLTKMKGAGSLAHEWGHAFDNLINKALGDKGFMSDGSLKLNNMKEFIYDMKWREATEEEIAEKVKKNTERALKSLKSNIKNVLPDYKIKTENVQKRDALIDKIADYALHNEMDYTYILNDANGIACLDELNDFAKEVTGHVISAENRKMLWHSVNNLHISGIPMEKNKVETDFYKNSKKFDSNCSKTENGYWQSNVEMFARAFACYVEDKLAEQGIRNDYLCGHADSALLVDLTTEEIIKAYPEGEERKTLNKRFDAIFNECIEKGLLHANEDRVLVNKRDKSL